MVLFFLTLKPYLYLGFWCNLGLQIPVHMFRFLPHVIVIIYSSNDLPSWKVYCATRCLTLNKDKSRFETLGNTFSFRPRSCSSRQISPSSTVHLLSTSAISLSRFISSALLNYLGMPPITHVFHDRNVINTLW